MPGRAYAIHYPNGDYELDARTDRPPPTVDETLRRRGQLWKVTSVDEGPPVVIRVKAAAERPSIALR